jgi:hypothetical protein
MGRQVEGYRLRLDEVVDDQRTVIQVQLGGNSKGDLVLSTVAAATGREEESFGWIGA